MRDILHVIRQWQAQGESVALATVVSTWGSAPRRVGAKMARNAAGAIAGSVSGGCVEGAVAAAGDEILQGGPPRLLRFGVADETAWDVGLACGGQIEVFIAPLAPARIDLVARELHADRPLATATVIAGSPDLLGRSLVLGPGGTLSADLAEPLRRPVEALAEEALAAGRPLRRSLPDSGVELFVDVELPPPVLIMVGGVHIAIALGELARVLDFRTVVVDPRRAFASADRFPHADELIQAWPDKAFDRLELNASTAVAMLTHDPRIDDPALLRSLASPAFYIGALGSRSTQARRRERLRAAGVPEEQIARIRGPIGLDIAAQTPEEIAVAILAEIVQVRHAGSA